MGIPGGTVTGLAVQGIEVTGKRLELLHKPVPKAVPIATIVGVPGAKVAGDLEAGGIGGNCDGRQIETEATPIAAWAS